MNDRARKVLPLAAGLLLGAALLVRFLGSTPEARPPLAAPVSAGSAAAPAPVASPAPPSSRAGESAPPAATAEVSRGTVVPVGPDDEVPLPEPEHPEPQHNDPIAPELPQTAAWRHGKLVRLTEVLGRDLERLEQERQAAESRGDTAEAQRLGVQLSRHRARLGTLREESAALAEAARKEEQAP